MTELITAVPVDSLIPTSFTKMQDYETCPRQYEAKHVLKTVKFQQNESARWGDYVHKCLENYIREGTPLPANVAMYQKYADAIKRKWPDAQQVIAERQIAINPYLLETGYFDGDVWIRAKLDVTVLRSGEAIVLDWKTGKVKDDPKQLMFYALLVFCLYPTVEQVRTGFVWLKEGTLSPPATFTKDQFDQILAMWVSKYTTILEAHELGVFPPKKSGLCNGWCEVKWCEHWKPKRPRR